MNVSGLLVSKCKSSASCNNSDSYFLTVLAIAVLVFSEVSSSGDGTSIVSLLKFDQVCIVNHYLLIKSCSNRYISVVDIS